MLLFLLDKVKENQKEFGEKVLHISSALQIIPSWLMIIMYFECRLNSKAKNSYTNAVGLIQFIPPTAQALGTSTEALLNMSNVQQLDYVYLYLKKYKGKINSLTDLYLCVFYPYAVGRPNDYILGSQNGTAAKIAEQNPVFDLDKDGIIQKGDVVSYIDKFAKQIGYTGETEKKKNFSPTSFC